MKDNLDKIYQDGRKNTTFSLIILTIVFLLCALVLILAFNYENLVYCLAVGGISLALFVTSLFDRRSSEKIYREILTGEESLILLATRIGTTVPRLKKTIQSFIKKGYIQDYVVERERLVKKNPKKKAAE